MCNLGSVGLPTKNWANLFHSSNLQTIKRPKLLETVRNGKTSTFLKVWFLENVKFVIVFSHHKLIQDSQEYFKHLEFCHILRMRRYGIRWKTLKMQKNRKIFQTNSHKSYEILQRICIRHSAVVGMFFPYRHVGIIWSRRRHACRHNSSFKIEWNTLQKTVKTKVSRVIHAYIISLP